MRLLAFLACLIGMSGIPAQTALPAWEPGMLDIHHISTGRGNAAFLILPDGTTLLLDAGEISDTHPRTRSPRNSTLRPDTSRSASEWIVDYIRQFHPNRAVPTLDYAVITHFHDDHFGEWDETRPRSKNGAYPLTGITTVGDRIPIKTLLDRGRTFPIDLGSADFQSKNEYDAYHIVQTLRAYEDFIAYHARMGTLGYDTIRPGSSTQIKLRKNAEGYPAFRVRNVAASGRVWTGYAEEEYTTLFPAGTYPGENPLSVCLKVTYGKFDYFAGGDISGMNDLGEPDANSVEAHLAPVVGPVDVATLNHHGNRDAQHPFFVRTLRPRVWVQQCWSSDHPGEEVLRRITSRRLYPGERDVFTTDMLEANQWVIGDRIHTAYKNLHGHVVVRVSEGGQAYTIYILNDYSKTREVLAVHGPYPSR